MQTQQQLAAYVNRQCPPPPFSFVFCESCSPITRLCKTFHVRGPQARIASYYKGASTPWNFGARTTTEGGFLPGQCIVCVKPTCARIQGREEYQEYCHPRCHYQNKLEVLSEGTRSRRTQKRSQRNFQRGNPSIQKTFMIGDTGTWMDWVVGVD